MIAAHMQLISTNFVQSMTLSNLHKHYCSTTMQLHGAVFGNLSTATCSLNEASHAILVMNLSLNANGMYIHTLVTHSTLITHTMDNYYKYLATTAHAIVYVCVQLLQFTQLPLHNYNINKVIYFRNSRPHMNTKNNPIIKQFIMTIIVVNICMPKNGSTN